MGSLVAGAVYRGDFEARLLDIVDDLKSIKNPTERARMSAQGLETVLLEIMDRARKGDF